MNYREIIGSTAMFGGASVIVVVLRLARVKVLASLLGPNGVGLFGMYTVIIESMAGLVGLGVGSGAVREIAAARASEDGDRLLATITALRWLSAVLAAVGVAALMIAPSRLAEAAFGTGAQGGAFVWLSVGVAFTVLSSSRIGLIQGFGRISALARIDIFGAVAGSVIGMSVLLLFGEPGIIWLILGPSLAILVAALWYARNLQRVNSMPTLATVFRQSRAILGLGASMMGAGLAVSWAQLGLRSYITRETGLEATGIYQAAWGISTVCVGFFLQAMFRDYYPRITAAIGEAHKARILVNEQMLVALVLAGPILLMVMAFAAQVISLVYAPSFHAAVPALRWMVLGNIMKLLSWPLAFVILAKGRALIFLATELIAHLSFLPLGVIGYELWGITGTGVAFLVLYAGYVPVMIMISRSLIQYRMARRNCILTSALFLANSLVFLCSVWSEHLALGVGIALSVAFWRLAWRELTEMIGQSPLRGIMSAFSRKLGR